jgi:anti-sigma regulatory factor (Ser/Thr protein kinase)
MGRDMNMETPPGAPRRPRAGSSPRASVLGSLTIEGHPSQVAAARAFVARTLATSHVKVDSDAATLLTSEIVTNAIQHTKSGVDGSVTIVVIAVPRGVLVEVIDDGSAGVPIVKGDLYAAEGHGLFLVQQLAAQWGYLRDPAGTTVWFHLPTPGGPGVDEDEPDPATERLSLRDVGRHRQSLTAHEPRESHPRLSVAAN